MAFRREVTGEYLDALSGTPQGIVLLACGGRNNWEWAKIYHALDTLRQSYTIAVVVTGGATGADTVAARWAEERGIQSVICPAPWKGPLGKSAGSARNLFMLEFMKPDLVAAFPGGIGTKHMVNAARHRKLRVFEYDGKGARK